MNNEYDFWIEFYISKSNCNENKKWINILNNMKYKLKKINWIVFDNLWNFNYFW